jgi:hypothetical protein
MPSSYAEATEDKTEGTATIRPHLSRSVLTHGSRQVRPWLIFDVRQNVPPVRHSIPCVVSERHWCDVGGIDDRRNVNDNFVHRLPCLCAASLKAAFRARLCGAYRALCARCSSFSILGAGDGRSSSATARENSAEPSARANAHARHASCCAGAAPAIVAARLKR